MKTGTYLGAMAGAVLGLALSAGTAASADFNLSYATPYTSSHPYAKADIEWMERIKEQTGGRVEITPYWGGSLITSREGVDELAAGVADIANITPIYARSGYEMVRNAPTFFYGYGDPEQTLDVYMKLWEEYPQFEADMAGVHVLGFNVGTPMHLMLREAPLDSLDDLQGLRIRSAVDYVGPLAAFGAEGVTMPMTETYPALERGVVDGVIAPYEALKSLSFAEVIKFYSELPHARGAYPSRAMNQGVWDSLPADIQKVFDDNILWLSEATLRYAIEAEAEGRAYGEELGVAFNAVSDEVQTEYAAAFVENAKKIAADLDALNLPGSEVLDSIRAAAGE